MLTIECLLDLLKLIKDYEVKNILELGSQYLTGESIIYASNHLGYTGSKFSYQFFEHLGLNFTCIDINGQQKAQSLNLGHDLTNKITQKFDLITNYGTIEHVGQELFTKSKNKIWVTKEMCGDSPQYNAFRNCHYLSKVDGIMVHEMPFTNNWFQHGEYDYSLEFFQKLADLNNYEIITLTVSDYPEKKQNLKNHKLAYAVLQKKEDNEFVTKEEFDQIPGLQKLNYMFIGS